MKLSVHRYSILLLTLSVHLFTLQAFGTCTLPAPAGLKAKEIASCQFKASWGAVSGAAKYHLKYKLSTASMWTSLNVGNVTSYTIQGLSASLTYDFKVASVCSSNEEGTYSAVKNATTISCTTPANVTATNILASSATIGWSVLCNEVKFSLRYRKTGSTAWTTVGNIAATSYQLTGLTANTSYQVKIKSKCSNGTTSVYSQVMTFTTSIGGTTSGKNVLLVIIDDARFDSYANMGAPPFFADTTISRIANEGVNFKWSFPVLSMCAPSRASIATGLYPHLHGITDNPPTSVSDTITKVTLPEILHDHGYYTGLIGKYHISKVPQAGYDYWMEVHNNQYMNTKYEVNGVYKTINGHQTNVITDSAIAFLHKVPAGKPFYLWFAYMAPHTPHTPRPEDEGLYDDATMPFPSNFTKYSVNNPQFLYNCHLADDTASVAEFYRGYFEMMAGVEQTLCKVFAELKSEGKMDSTLIIFMSDNGYLIGEHQLLEKQLAYEESIRIPISMRYPGLIPAGKKVNNQLAENIDIAPTILDFAGIEDTFGMQGVSLLKLMNNQVSRTEMLYEFFNKECVPDIRGIRSFDYKYVKYNCDEVTGEFFDLQNDPKENTNLINNPAFASLIQQYDDKLTFWRNYYQDYTWDSMYSCHLTNPQRLAASENSPLTLLNVFPNPSVTSMTIHFISSEKSGSSIRIINAIGQTLFENNSDEPQTELSENISVDRWPSGNYFVIVQHGSSSYRQSFVVQ